MQTTEELGAPSPGLFRHEAFLFRGDQDFLDGVGSFVREAVAGHEPVLVALTPERLERLQHEIDDLDRQQADVLLVDVEQMARNPARIIPTCRDFLDGHLDGKRVRGVGETAWPGRSPAELLEVQRHEVLLGEAFGARDRLWLLCLYEVPGLPADAVDEIYRSHPYVLEGGRSGPNERYTPAAGIPPRLDEPLPPPPTGACEVRFGSGELAPVRRVVAAWAQAEGTQLQRRELFVFAVNELATNSVEHGGGAGTLLLWREEDQLVAEVRDHGYIREPLVGRVRPDQQQGGGRGVWLVNQICDLVQIRSRPGTTVVRARLAVHDAACSAERHEAQ